MLEVHITDSHAAIDGAAWDAVVGDGSPFLEHTFLRVLETSGAACPETGWTPRPVTVWRDGRLVGAAPTWVKTHSMGEFVYDHGWADAVQRAGVRYYPKLVVGVPFTPVSGERLLVLPGEDVDAVRSALLLGLRDAAADCHGLHVLFPDEATNTWLCGKGLFARLQYQFHWYNAGYKDFEGFLATFVSKKRNKIRRERKELRGMTIEAVEGPGPDVLDALHRFYSHTCRQFGPWGRVYLSAAAFRELGECWADRLHAVVARDASGQPVAGAFNVRKGKRLYGRYWGCDDDVKFLHFEVCYYRAIDYCIAAGLEVFEPGHGGEHKYRRGFRPTLTFSAHALPDPRIHASLAAWANREEASVRAAVAAEAEERGDP